MQRATTKSMATAALLAQANGEQRHSNWYGKLCCKAQPKQLLLESCAPSAESERSNDSSTVATPIAARRDSALETRLWKRSDGRAHTTHSRWGSRGKKLSATWSQPSWVASLTTMPDETQKRVTRVSSYWKFALADAFILVHAVEQAQTVEGAAFAVTQATGPTNVVASPKRAGGSGTAAPNPMEPPRNCVERQTSTTGAKSFQHVATGRNDTIAIATVAAQAQPVATRSQLKRRYWFAPKRTNRMQSDPERRRRHLPRVPVPPASVSTL